MTPDAAAAAAARPRVEGVREQEILDAALEVLAEVGYDRLTMDAVAQRAKASKATLYRRWTSKAKLVVEALAQTKTTPEIPDTGDLRSDLLTAFCGHGGLTDHDTTSTFGAVVTAVTTDPEFAAEFRAQVVEPKSVVARTVFERARDRGELRADLDLDLVVPALAGIVLHRVFVLGEEPDADLVERAVDQIILPAVRPQGPSPS
ncbi:MAG TPA: TetR/AcrR family transcriptional regulator [Nocardioides sp.]|jgi:AcrR family transcriptional regulator|uniref:TetR/AcrR family transcriptional regulator n=1 Tax=Nocardioides sp. TaxID=35761 RepID=UPI002E36A800|nr:TetR/AcrR family transcriptional regulator [Nocardioides sp.]HEX3931918.1 TetR/AcrR family transcriptional regulator [Nocardioides sp.]